MLPLAFALLSFICWGTGDIFGTFAARRLGALSVSVWSYSLRIIVFGIYVPFAWSSLKQYTLHLFLVNILLGIALALGFLCFNRGLKVGNPSIVGTIAATYTAVVVVLSLLFLHESLNIKEAAAILAIFSGVLLVSLDRKVLRLKEVLNSGTLLAILAMLFWGIYFTFVRNIVRKVGWFWPNYVSFSLLIFAVPIIKLSKLKVNKINESKGFFPVLMAVLLTGTAEFSFNFAISRGNSAVIAPIAGAYPILFVILASFIFHEPIKRRQIAGVLLSLIGLVALSLVSF